MAWMRVAVVVGCIVGIAGVVRTLTAGSDVDVRLAIAVVAMWQAAAASGVAAIVLVVTAVQQLRKRPLSITTSRVPRVIAAIAGVSMAVAAAIFATYEIGEVLVPGIAGVILVVVAAFGRDQPWSVRNTLLALLATIAIFELPREANMFGLTWFRADTHVKRDVKHSENCQAMNWGNQPLNLQSIARSARVSSLLSGNVGELVPRGQQFGGDGELLVNVTGNIDVGWLPCLLPLYKPAGVDVSLQLALSVNTRRGESSASCHGSGTLKLAIEHTVKGVAACRDVREQLAGEVGKQLDTIAHGLLAR